MKTRKEIEDRIAGLVAYSNVIKGNNEASKNLRDRISKEIETLKWVLVK